MPVGISSLQGTLNLHRSHGASIADVTAPTKEPPCFPLDKSCSAETEGELDEQLKVSNNCKSTPRRCEQQLQPQAPSPAPSAHISSSAVVVASTAYKMLGKMPSFQAYSNFNL